MNQVGEEAAALGLTSRTLKQFVLDYLQAHPREGDVMKGDVLKGHLEMLVLVVVRDGATYGYAIIEELRTRSHGSFDLPEGTIYPALHRLEKGGALKSRWQEVGGRCRREYSVTLTGRRLLAARRREWSAFAGAVTGVLGAS
ncbi:MAG: PadR family transcriptional regulator [Acidobacteriota bacterium]